MIKFKGDNVESIIKEDNGPFVLIFQQNIPGVKTMIGHQLIGTNNSKVYFGVLALGPKTAGDHAAQKLMDDLGLGLDGNAMDDLRNMRGDGLPPGALGMNDGMANKIGDLTPEQKVDLGQCLTASTKKEKNSICTVLYGDDNNTFEMCMDNFCTACCSQAIPPHKLDHEMKRCVKVCDQNQGDYDLFEMCSNPGDNHRSVLRFCNDIPDYNQSRACQIDTCNVLQYA